MPATESKLDATRRVAWCHHIPCIHDIWTRGEARRGNAKRQDLHEMLLIALLSTLTDGRTCVEMEDYGCAAERSLWTFRR